MSIISDIFAGGIQGVIGSITSAIHAVKADPTKVVELESAVEQAKIALITMSIQADTAAMQAVNSAMTAESKSEHWMQWSWRPLGAFLFYGLLLHNYVVNPYLQRYLGLVPILVPTEVWYIFLALLGVSAYTRGQAQIEQVKKGV